MDGSLDAHRRYLAALRDVCARSPAANGHQLEALERELALAADAADIAAYLAASGGVFEVTRSAWLDRCANHVRIGVAVRDRWLARSAAIEYAHALDASGHADWSDRLAAASAAAAPVAARGATACQSFAELALGLVELRAVGDEPVAAELRHGLVALHSRLVEADPAFALARLDDLPEHRLRTPWTGEGLAAIARWLDEAVGATAPAAEIDYAPDQALAELEAGRERWRRELERTGEGAPGPEAPADPVAPYRELADALPGDDRATVALREAAVAAAEAAAAAPSPHAALERLVSGGFLTRLAGAPVRARAEDAIERLAVWPDPIVEHHWRSLLDAVASAPSPADVELASAYAAACFSVESAWNTQLLAALLGPLRAAFAHGRDPRPARAAGLAGAAEATAVLLGVGPRALLEIPRVREFVETILVPLAPGDGDGLGAHTGEAGFPTLGEARDWLGELRAQGRPLPQDSAALREAVGAQLAGAGAPEPAAAGRAVSLWGRTITLHELGSGLARPQRPPLA